MNITIVGGGFGGVKTALELAKQPTNQITLITNKPDFQYYPALYSAATGHSHLESWVPLGEIFAGKKNIRVEIDTIETIDPDKKEVKGKSGRVYAYETCVLALGSVTTYFGIKGLDIYSYGIKSAEEIKRLKQHIYEDIAVNHTLDKRYVIVGAGPTGVELSAALGSYLEALCEHYKVKKRSAIHIELIEAAPRVLPKMSEKTSRVVQRQLEKIGVKVRTGKKVEEATAQDIIVDGKPMESKTIIWTSGVANHPFYKNNEKHFEFMPNGRIKVDEYMLAGKDLYVIGDNAATPFTGLAQTALHDALFVSGNLKRIQKGYEPKKYKAVMPPIVVPVGENWSVFEWHWLRLYGFIGSLLRRAADLIGYNDVLPLGQALGVWHATMIMEDDYFAPTITPEDATSEILKK